MYLDAWERVGRSKRRDPSGRLRLRRRPAVPRPIAAGAAAPTPPWGNGMPSQLFTHRGSGSTEMFGLTRLHAYMWFVEGLQLRLQLQP